MTRSMPAPNILNQIHSSHTLNISHSVCSPPLPFTAPHHFTSSQSLHWFISHNHYPQFFIKLQIQFNIIQFNSILIIYKISWIFNYNEIKQSQRTHHKFWKRALQTRQSESRRRLNDDESHESQQCWFEDDCERRWFVARKQRCKIEMLTQWWRERC